MYFPWVGLLEQIKLADVYVHYDDVQFSRGFFSSRVQVKTRTGQKWMSVPIRDHHLGQKINEALVDERQDWRGRHRELLRQSYKAAPFVGDMLALVDVVFALPVRTLADVSRASTMALVDYFDLRGSKVFIDSSSLSIPGTSSKRVHDIAKHFDATVYVTGHGAKNYLDHELFEASEIQVEYMEYRYSPYPQLHGPFIPFVTALDLVANRGRAGIDSINPRTTNWREFTKLAVTGNE